MTVAVIEMPKRSEEASRNSCVVRPRHEQAHELGCQFLTVGILAHARISRACNTLTDL
jgi:hypothetical protein